MNKADGACTLGQPEPAGPVQVRLLEHAELRRCHKLLNKYHYLKSLQPVGERLYYVATDAKGRWLALLVFNAAAKHLKHRDRWIKWTPQQRRRRLSLVVNNSRFLLLPAPPAPNRGSHVLRLVLDRLSADWQQRYGHPVLVVESFVDPEQFDGTVYSANGWIELGQTDGWGRHGRDYYVKHNKPKRLFVRELCPEACRSLQAEHLKADLAGVESKVSPHCAHTVKEMRSMTEHFKQVPEFRGRVESYPVWSLLTIMLLAVLCGAPRGQKDLAKFARSLSQPQRRAVGIRRNRRGHYPSPSQSTYCRLLQGVEEEKVEEMVLRIQEQVRGKPPADELIALDGKEPNHGGGQGVLSAVSVPSLYYLGSAIVETKTNEIPIAPKLFQRLDLEGRLVSLDAINTQDETARAIVMEAGADYLLTVKKNRKTVYQAIEKIVPAPEAGFPPSSANANPSRHGGME